MKIDELVILMEREGSSMAATWNEYLCLKRITHDEFELSIRMYEGLGEAHEYYDEELEDYVLPESIGGFPVVGTDDGIIVGGELIFCNKDQAIQFSDMASLQVRSWLQANRFDCEVVENKINSDGLLQK